MKINVSILGNCQLLPFSNQLRNNNNFNVTYASPYSELDRAKNFLQTLNDCDIFIATLTKYNYRKDIELGTEHIISNLPKNTKFIITPSIYFSGYFPTFGSIKDFDALSYNFEKKEFYFSKYHDYLPIIVAQNKIKYFNYENLKNHKLEDIMKTNIDRTFLELRNREKKCCVIISDFLEKIYNKKLCFYTFNHPYDEILFNLYEKIIQKINEYLNVKIKIIFNKQNLLYYNNQSYVHDFVLDYLKLETNKKKMNNKIFNNIVDYYKDKNLSINKDSQPYINSIEVIKKTHNEDLF